MVVSTTGVASKERIASPESVGRKPKGLRSKDGCLTCRIRRKVIIGALDHAAYSVRFSSRNVIKESRRIRVNLVVACTLSALAIPAIVQNGSRYGV